MTGQAKAAAGLHHLPPPPRGAHGSPPDALHDILLRITFVTNLNIIDQFLNAFVRYITPASVCSGAVFIRSPRH